MRILTLEDKYYNLETLPEEIDDLRFAILDNSTPTFVDYYYIPLIFLESFNAPAVVLQIGDLETLPLSSLNDRGFSVYSFNPLSSFAPNFLPIEIVDIYSDVTWYAPRLRNGQFLCVPLDDGPKPRCVYFVKEISRNCEIVDYGQVF